MRRAASDDGRAPLLRPISPLLKKNHHQRRAATAAAAATGAANGGNAAQLEGLIKAHRRLSMAGAAKTTSASSTSSSSLYQSSAVSGSTSGDGKSRALDPVVKATTPLRLPLSSSSSSLNFLTTTMARARAQKGRGARASKRRLALLLVATYAASVAGDASADGDRIAAGPSASTNHEGPRREQHDARHESLGASLLRLVEESATRPTQTWFYPATSDSGSGDARSSGSSSVAASIAADSADDGAASLATALFDGTAAPLSPVTSWIAANPANPAEAEAEAPPHKPLRPPRPSDFVIFLLAALTLFAAAGGGIGGGTLFVPLFTVVGGFAPTNAVALSNVTVFGGAVANFLLNVRRPYARALRALPRNALSAIQAPPPLIDWALILIMEPSTLVGALMGGYIHRLLPSWLLLTLLSALLVFLAWQLVQKGAATYAAETREQQRDRAAAWANRAQADAEAGGLSAPLLGSGSDEEEEDKKPTKKRPSSSGGAAGPPLIIVAGGPDSSSLALTDDIGRGDQGDASAASGSASSSVGRLAAAPQQQQQQQPQPQPSATASAPAAADQDPLERLLKMPARVPYVKVAVIALLTLWMLAADTAKMRLPCGSLAYVLASLSIVPLAVAITLAQRAAVLRRAKAAAEAHEALDAARARGRAEEEEQQQRQQQQQQQQAGLLESPGAASTAGGGRWSPAAVEAALASHVRWTRKNSILYPLLSTIAGVCASMFGIGGGVVKGPLMLSLGVCPEVAAATSSTMILFTSAGASLFYFNAGFVQRDYAAVLLAVAFVVTWAGQLASQRLVQTLGRRSIIVFVMAAMMVAAALVAVLQSAFATRAAVRAGDLWDWGSICSRGGD